MTAIVARTCWFIFAGRVCLFLFCIYKELGQVLKDMEPELHLNSPSLWFLRLTYSMAASLSPLFQWGKQLRKFISSDILYCILEQVDKFKNFLLFPVDTIFSNWAVTVLHYLCLLKEKNALNDIHNFVFIASVNDTSYKIHYQCCWYRQKIFAGVVVTGNNRDKLSLVSTTPAMKHKEDIK